MYPSIKSLLSLTTCVSRLGSTPTLTPCYCPTSLRGEEKEGLDLDWQSGRVRPDWYNICWAGDGGRVKPEFTVGIVSMCCRHAVSALHLSRWPSANTCIYTVEGQMHTLLLWYELSFQGHPEQNVIIVKLIHLSAYFQFRLIYVMKYLEKRDVYRPQAKWRGRNHSVHEELNDKKSAQK